MDYQNVDYIFPSIKEWGLIFKRQINSRKLNLKTKIDMLELSKEQLEAMKSAYNQSMAYSHFEQLLKENGLIKEEMKKGEWYKHGDYNSLMVWNGGKSTYGFSDGSFDVDWKFYGFSNDMVLATDEEVETALIKEAKKRGFKEGVKINTVNYKEAWKGKSKKIDKYDYKSPSYYNNENELFLGNKLIFNKGKWATIIEEEKCEGCERPGNHPDTPYIPRKCESSSVEDVLRKHKLI